MTGADESELVMKWHAFLVAGSIIVCLVAAEAFARLWLGLGTPPLIVRDPEINYLFAPSKTYHRFGNTISYNAFSMRSDEVTRQKADPNELRVIVMGDSVINGGALTDDFELATRLAQMRLAEELRRPVWIGNVSAGAWGPANLLAYARKYGWFDADVVLLVLNSHDISDVREFQQDLGPDFPLKPPWFALEEAATRYLPRYAEAYLPARLTWPVFRASKSLRKASATPRLVKDSVSTPGRRLLVELIEYAKSHVPMVAVLHHLEQNELKDGMSEAGVIMHNYVRDCGIPLIMLDQYFAAYKGHENLYRDHIHISAAGQRLYADAIVYAVRTFGNVSSLHINFDAKYETNLIARAARA